MKRQISRATAKVLLRAWDSHSCSRLSLLPNGDLGPQGDGFDSSAYENDDVLEQDLNRLDEQAAALHSSQNSCDIQRLQRPFHYNADGLGRIDGASS